MSAVRLRHSASAKACFSRGARRHLRTAESFRAAQAVSPRVDRDDLSRSAPLFDNLDTLSPPPARSSVRPARAQRALFSPSPAPAQPLNSTRALSWDGTNLSISNPRTGDAPTIVSQWWLRDHCPCVQCTNETTKQRQINLLRQTSSLARIQHVDLPPASSLMHVTWTDGHKSTYDRSTILQHRSRATRALRQGDVPLNLWGHDIARSPPAVPHTDISASSLGPVMTALRQNGLVFIPSTPVSPEASEALLSLIGPIRNTHWGAFTVVTSDLTSNDTAWTSEALDPHNDNTYFSDAAGLQMLHLLSHEQGQGGASLFVDGFACAAQLHAADPEAYAVLATVGIHAHSSGDEGVNVQPSDAVPVLRHDSAGVLRQVRWNNADRAGLDCPLDRMDEWYAAAAKYQALLDREENRFWIQLIPGSPVIFDNWRVLHGRSEFNGKRTVCGGYINYDDYVSRYRAACYDSEQIRASTVTG